MPAERTAEPQMLMLRILVNRAVEGSAKRRQRLR
jgi:hypothetical protein